MTEDLLPRVAGGDPAAVRECISLYGGRVRAVALRSLGPAAADDATQEVFIDLWRNAGRYDPARGCEAVFVMTIARRRCIDARRKLGARPAPTPLPDALPEAVRPDRVSVSEEAARARSVMDNLGGEQRTAIELAVCDGFTHEEVARKMSLPLGTVKSHIRRGLSRVRAALGGGDR